jgi:hypothetical protein
MFDVCINSLLRHAYEIEMGSGPEPLKSLDDGEELPPFPALNDVDVIYGGPPW